MAVKAVVHAASQFLISSNHKGHPLVLLKVDYSNDSNKVRQDCFLQVVKEKFFPVYFHMFG